MIVRTRKLSDKSLHGFAKRLLSIVPDTEAFGQYAGGVPFRVNAEDVSEIPHATNERLIDKLTIKKAGANSDYVVFGRGTMAAFDPQHRQPEQHRFDIREPNAYFDEIAFFEQHNRQNVDSYIRFNETERVAVAREIGKFAAPISEAEPGQAAAVGQVLDQNLADLQRVTTEFLERSAAARQEDERAFREREAHLRTEFENKFSELEHQRQLLEERRAALNDREPQHERRRLREHLTGRLQLTISDPPKETGVRERASNYLYVAVGIAFVAASMMLASLSQSNIPDGSAAFWALSFKSLLAGVAGAAFIWSGLSGLKAAAVAGRRYEQTIQRYAFDMDRASWTVETLLQMNSIESAQVPDQWIEAVCRDLFVTDQPKRDEPRPLDALAALLDVTAKAKIGTNGVDFEVDRKGARRAAAQQNND